MIFIRNIFLLTTKFLLSKAKVPYVLFLLLLFISIDSFSQCDLYTNQGNNVIGAIRSCAPKPFEWEINYSVQTGETVQFLVDWGNGDNILTTPTAIGTDGTYTIYSDTAKYIFPRGGNDCNYTVTTYVVVNGVQCMSSIQTQNVTVWDIDSENGGEPRIEPVLYRICLGDDATINFDDNSIWNCTPNAGENDNINNRGRWVQWIYGTGPVGNRIPNVEVNGNPETYSFDGPVEYLPGPIETSNSQSYDIYAPATSNPSDIGKEFVVQLRNWNICNPYDADQTDGDPLNPANPNGDSTYILTEARIVIVDKSAPDFQTRSNDSSGPVKTEFCVGETVFLKT